MKILVVGGDLKGAWQMRGVQLGRALGARVTARPSDEDWRWAQIVVLVKRAALVWSAKTRQLSVPVVWDALDFWLQPEQNATPLAQVVTEAKQIADAAGVSVMIGATRQMAADLGGVYLPHHCRIGLTPSPPRSTARVVGYDGTKKYLGKWLPMLEHACEAMGLRFVVNPTDLRHVDALVSLRDGRWDGDVCRQWKSGVKQVNAICAGKPILSQSGAAQREMAAVGVTADDPDAVCHALHQLTGSEMRDVAFDHARQHAREFTVDAVAAQYLAILREAGQRAA